MAETINSNWRSPKPRLAPPGECEYCDRRRATDAARRVETVKVTQERAGRTLDVLDVIVEKARLARDRGDWELARWFMSLIPGAETPSA